eukprot:350269-Chlamydomonas_euryale.AAC.2
MHQIAELEAVCGALVSPQPMQKGPLKVWGTMGRDEVKAGTCTVCVVCLRSLSAQSICAACLRSLRLSAESVCAEFYNTLGRITCLLCTCADCACCALTLLTVLTVLTVFAVLTLHLLCTCCALAVHLLCTCAQDDEDAPNPMEAYEKFTTAKVWRGGICDVGA